MLRRVDDCHMRIAPMDLDFGVASTLTKSFVDIAVP